MWCVPLCYCWANMERSGSILCSCRASQGAAHTPSIAPIESAIPSCVICFVYWPVLAATDITVPKKTSGLHVTASMCAQMLKESGRKCEHSFAELSGAPSAHPSGEKSGFKIRSSNKHWGQSKFSLLGDGLQGIKLGSDARCRRGS